MIIQPITPNPDQDTLDELQELFEGGFIEFLPGGRVRLSQACRDMTAAYDAENPSSDEDEWQ